MPYIYSTLTASVEYTGYSQGPGNIPIRERGVLIKGGAGLADDHLYTPKGVATQVTDEELAFLETNSVFQLHKKGGFIVVEKSKKEKEADKIAAGMSKDPSSPKTLDDFKDPNGAKVNSVGAPLK